MNLEEIKYNSSMTEFVKVHNNRDKFFEDIGSIEIDELVKKYILK